MFDVFKRKSSEKDEPLEANEYVVKNKLPDNIEYVARNRIKEYREKLGLTQANVANMLNITRQSLSLIEKEKQTPSILMCWLIAKVLNADVAELFYFEEIEEDQK